MLAFLNLLGPRAQAHIKYKNQYLGNLSNSDRSHDADIDDETPRTPPVSQGAGAAIWYVRIVKLKMV